MKLNKITSATQYNDLFTLRDAKKLIFDIDNRYESLHGRSSFVNWYDTTAINELRNVEDKIDSRLPMEHIEKTIELQDVFNNLMENEDEHLTPAKFTSLLVKALLLKIQLLENKLVKTKLKSKKKIAKLEDALYKKSEEYDDFIGLDRRNTYNFVDLAQKWQDNYELQTNNVVVPIRVMIHDPATIVFWSDGTKTVVKKHKSEKRWDAEKALYAAIVKRLCGVETLISISEMVGKNPKDADFTNILNN